MATKKKQRVKLGREIRRATGIKLPLAMYAAKRIIRGDSYDVKYDDRFAPFVKYVPLCGDGCCGTAAYLEGPRGRYQHSL